MVDSVDGPISDVKAWLTRIGFEGYAAAFAENGVDAAMLPKLTNDDLKDLGVSRLADRKRLLDAAAQLRESDEKKEPAPSTAVMPAGERRPVTVLFADLSGFTRLSSKLDAEATHALLNRFFEIVDGIVEDCGGRIDKHIGDNVMAVFGAPIAHTNDPERAVRAALDIHAAMPRLGEELGRALTVHIGIASGQVVASGTGSDAHRAYTVTGDSVNLASRLQDKAGSGETLISDSLHRILAARIDCDPLDDVSVKGLDTPVRMWRVRSLRAEDVGLGRVAFVGRRSELVQFSGFVEACRASGTGRTTLIRGEAGMGKTRLVEEFTSTAIDKGFAVHKGLVLDFGVGKGQNAVRSIVSGLLAVAPGGSEALRRKAAEAAIARSWLSAQQRVFLDDLLDLPRSHEDRARYDAMDNATRNEGARTMVASLLRGASAQTPVAIVFEDVHWADRLTLTLLARMSATVANCPALLIATSRVDGDPLDAAWRGTTGGCPLTTVDLGPLRKEDALALAGTLHDATNTFALECVARAGGNPLFLEQLLRNAEESHLTAIPATIQSLVLARVDRLPAPDKRALQAASIIGQRFTLDVLRHLIDDSDYACDGLIEHHLLRPFDDGYLFAHALIQEGVYSSLLKTTAGALHRRAAEWFAGRDPVLHAEQLDRAGEPAAAQAYLGAAEGQVIEYRYESALRLVKRGLAVAAKADDRFALALLQGNILHDLGDMQAALPAYEAALNDAHAPADLCRALLGLAAVKRVTDNLEGALADLARAEDVAESQGLTDERARIHTLRGNLLFPRGDIEGCLREHLLGLEFAQRAGSAALEAAAFGGIGDAEYVRGHMKTAHARLQSCVELAHAHGLGRVEVANLAQVAHAMLYFEPQDVALDAAIRAIQAAERVGHKRAELNACSAAIFASAALDEIDRCREYIERAQGLVRSLGAWRFEQSCLQYLGHVELAEGRREAAVGILRAAMDFSRRTGVTFHGPQICSVLARALDDPDERRGALAEGEAIIGHGCVGHNQLRFYPDAMEVMLDLQDHDELERYATALENFTRAEPLAWSDFFVARGRALSAFARGHRDDAAVRRLEILRNEAERLRLKPALPAMDRWRRV